MTHMGGYVCFAGGRVSTVDLQVVEGRCYVIQMYASQLGVVVVAWIQE